MSDLFPCDLGCDIEVVHDVELVEIEMDCDVDVDSAPYERLEVHHDVEPLAELDEPRAERAVPVGLSLGTYMRSPVVDTLPFAPIEPAELAKGSGPVARIDTEAVAVPFPRSEIETPARIRAATVPRVARVVRATRAQRAEPRVSAPIVATKPAAIASLDTRELARIAEVDAVGAAKLARVARVARASTRAHVDSFRPSASFEAAWFATPAEDASPTYDGPPRRMLANVLVIAGLVVALGAGIALALAFAR